MANAEKQVKDNISPELVRAHGVAAKDKAVMGTVAELKENYIKLANPKLTDEERKGQLAERAGLVAKLEEKMKAVWPLENENERAQVSNKVEFRSLSITFQKLAEVNGAKDIAFNTVLNDPELWGNMKAAGVAARLDPSPENVEKAKEARRAVQETASGMIGRDNKCYPGVLQRLNEELDKKMSEAVDEEAKKLKKDKLKEDSHSSPQAEPKSPQDIKPPSGRRGGRAYG